MAGGILIAAILGAGAGVFASPVVLGTPAAVNYTPTQETKDFWVFSNVAEFNDTEVGLPHDQFLPNTLVVNQGDKVAIHFFNTEDEPESHNFVLQAYSISVNLAQGQNQTITFTADKAGVFLFYCSYHLPSMRGQLIVLPTSS